MARALSLIPAVLPMPDAVASYFQNLSEIRSSGLAVDETSYYGALETLLNEVGRELKPRVRFVLSLKNSGAGIPDGGLFTPDQFQKRSSAPIIGQLPLRGAVEAKGPAEDVAAILKSEQAERYSAKYGQLLITNYREFLLAVPGRGGKPVALESYRLAESEVTFWAALAHPRTAASLHSRPLAEFLKRVMLHSPSLSAPADVAWFLASYARDARARVESADIPALALLRSALEEALGISFEGARGEHFFRSTLVQTLFYGIFSGWVLWSQQAASPTFDWRTAVHYLRVPVLRKLFHEISDPGQLELLRLTEVLDWASAVLSRVDREVFFTRFQQEHAVQYFYEPFLEAYDPLLRRQLGVWYTPSEVVRYMVARVDAVLRQDLGIEDGLADPRVFVLDPCCGTGAYLVEVLQRIHDTLASKGANGLLASDLRDAAIHRIFGFEILPAPFVVAHLQLGLQLARLGASLSDSGKERPGVFLTNALTGWEPPKGPKQLTFAELEAEREAAERVKRHEQILVVLGNPPYNGFAGMAVRDERALSDAYRTTKQAPAPQGQGLNDLYVRFFRMAERRIIEQTGRGVVCFISNYSWLDGLSFTGMRERYLEAFDSIWIDCLNGDKYKTGKLTPDGQPDPSVFSTESNAEGIQVGTAIALLVRHKEHQPTQCVRFRHLWGKTKRVQLLETAEQDGTSLYEELHPPLELGLPLVPALSHPAYASWPALPELFPVSFPGVQTGRDLDLIDIDRARLEARMRAYFDPALSDADAAQVVPSVMTSTARYDAQATRRHLLQRGMAIGSILRYQYRPFDHRYVYWYPETKLLDEKRPQLRPMVRPDNSFLTSRQKAERGNEGTPFLVTRHLPDRHLTRPGSICFPLETTAQIVQGTLLDEVTVPAAAGSANLSHRAAAYLRAMAPSAKTDRAAYDRVWMHALAVGYSPAYLAENADGIRQGWPRIPLPAEPEVLLASAELGRRLAALLDPETAVSGATSGSIRPEPRDLATIAGIGGRQLSPEAGDLRVRVGWGYRGPEGIAMPGPGKLGRRDYTSHELSAFEQAPPDLGLSLQEISPLLGETTVDVYLNDVAYWRNVPVRVWSYTIGGYQVLKKWLSYREHNLLGRDLAPAEAREFTNIARRIAAILLLEPQLDANYARAKACPAAWPPDAG